MFFGNLRQVANLARDGAVGEGEEESEKILALRFDVSVKMMLCSFNAADRHNNNITEIL